MPLSAGDARAWRTAHPQISVPRALLAPAATGVAVSVLAWALFGGQVAWSAAYGALAAVLPAAIAAKGTLRWGASGFAPSAALTGLLRWEGLKIALTIALLVAAPRILETLNWPALLIGLALTLKMYWVGLISARRVKPRGEQARG